MPNTFNMFGPQKKIKRKKNLVEFRAGKMKLDNNNWVYPDKRKGLVFIHQTSDGMIHFCWKDRISDKIEDDLIVFPQETIFKRLPECKTGRVYLLKFKDSKKLFIWMQEPREEKDVEFCRLVNEILNQRRTETPTSGSKDININEFTNLLGQLNEIGALNETDLMEIFGLTHNCESGTTAESDVTNIYGLNTNPFQIGSTFSTTTIVDRIPNVEEPSDNLIPSRDSPHIQPIADIIGHSSPNPASVMDPNSIFSENTMKRLSKNTIFKSKVLELVDKTDKKAVDITTEQFKTGIRNFGTILQDINRGTTLLTEMGFPDHIINKVRDNNIVDLLKDIEEYYKENN